MSTLIEHMQDHFKYHIFEGEQIGIPLAGEECYAKVLEVVDMTPDVPVDLLGLSFLTAAGGENGAAGGGEGVSPGKKGGGGGGGKKKKDDSRQQEPPPPPAPQSQGGVVVGSLESIENSNNSSAVTPSKPLQKGGAASAQVSRWATAEDRYKYVVRLCTEDGRILTDEESGGFQLQYTVQFANMRRIMRHALAKNKFKAFIRESGTKANWVGAPWVARPELVRRYGLSLEPPVGSPLGPEERKRVVSVFGCCSMFPMCFVCVVCFVVID
jgi:hypothetical protein